jgi:hypothetical protein
MYHLARLATTTGKRPHRLLKLHKARNHDPSRFFKADTRAFSGGNLLDFDHAVLDYWDWVQAKQEEQKPVRAPKPLAKGYTMGRRYASMGDIFALYGPQDASGSIDPDVAAIDLDELMDDYHNFDPMEDDEWDR